VLGAGPAGIGAALAATEAGVETVIVDCAAEAGGQVYRAPLNLASPPENSAETGQRLRDSLGECPAESVFECRIWSVDRNFRVDGIDPQGARMWRPKTIVAALGTTERVIPFPGWTTPGVFGLAATTLLLKSQSMLPGDNCVIAGSGPLLSAVAQGIIAGGGKVAAIVDLAGRGEWLAATPALMSRPKDLWRGLKWVHDIRRAKVPVFFRHAVKAVEQAGDGLKISIEAVDGNGRRMTDRPVKTLSVDSLSIGNGLTPATELTRLLGAAHEFDVMAGGWVPTLDDGQRTTLEGLYAAGDGAGITGADAAFLEGKIAGFTVALDLKRIDEVGYRRLSANPAARLKRVARAGRRMARLMALREGHISGIEPDTIVCRCEDVTRREVDAAIDLGASDINQLKSWTRCGMGPCQGRTCGDVVAAIVATRKGGREKVGCWSPRIPLMAVNMNDLGGNFVYEDIPIPEAAPL
jgi:thioredoxin reductase/bacterioferritin-associated ferredoxin